MVRTRSDWLPQAPSDYLDRDRLIELAYARLSNETLHSGTITCHRHR